MITENKDGFSVHNKRIKDAATAVLATDVLTRGQVEDGSLDVTFDNVTVNGTLTAAALTTDSVAPAITAKAGGGQDATLALSKNLNIVTTVATAADSVTLPAAVVGLRITIVNLGANALAVFPYTSDSINDAAADASVTQDPETTVTYNCYTGVLWESDNESVDVFDRAYITGLLTQSLTTSITAFATGGQASATALTKNFNNVTVCATAGDSVKLPSAETGLEITIKNSGAAALDIFPASGDSIDALAVNLAIRIAPSSVAKFFAISATVWESNGDASLTLVAPTTNSGQLRLLAANSAGNTVTTITNASQTTTAVMTIPDTNRNSNFVMTTIVNGFTGNNTHSGTETFSNAAGVTTDIISERTAGAGTAIKTPIISAGAATLAPTAAQSGSVIALAKADGITVTLPACSATNIGIRYRFQIAVSCTSVGYIINTTGTDVFLGGIYGSIAAPNATNDAFFGTSTVNKTITLNATTTCGLIGGWVEVVCVSATQWMVTGVTLGTGTIATPFSN